MWSSFFIRSRLFFVSRDLDLKDRSRLFTWTIPNHTIHPVNGQPCFVETQSKMTRCIGPLYKEIE